MPLIGDDPEAAEAALLQAYPGRDPLREVLTGQISLRKFRVMVDHLPPDNPLERSRTGQRPVLWNVEARLREILKSFSPEMELSYLPVLLSREDAAASATQDDYDTTVQAELESLW